MTARLLPVTALLALIGCSTSEHRPGGPAMTSDVAAYKDAPPSAENDRTHLIIYFRYTADGQLAPGYMSRQGKFYQWRDVAIPIASLSNENGLNPLYRFTIATDAVASVEEVDPPLDYLIKSTDAVSLGGYCWSTHTFIRYGDLSLPLNRIPLHWGADGSARIFNPSTQQIGIVAANPVRAIQKIAESVN